MTRRKGFSARFNDFRQDKPKQFMAIVIILTIVTFVGAMAFLSGMSGWEITVTLGKVDVDGELLNINSATWGPHDPDDPATGQPGVTITSTALRHVNKDGNDRPAEYYEDTFEVILDDPTDAQDKQLYIFDLHYFRFSVIIKSKGDLNAWAVQQPLYTSVQHYGECQFPSKWWSTGTEFDGEMVYTFVYPIFDIDPWQYRSLDPTDYGYEAGWLTGVWSGVMQAQIVGLQVGNLQQDVAGIVLAEFDEWLDSDVDYYEQATNLDLRLEVGGTTLTEHEWSGLGLDDDIHSTVYIDKLYGGILPGSYWDCHAGWIAPFDPNFERWYTGKVINGVVAYEVEVQVAMVHNFFLQAERGTTTTTITTGRPPTAWDPLIIIILIIVIGVVVGSVACVLGRRRGRGREGTTITTKPPAKK